MLSRRTLLISLSTTALIGALAGRAGSGFAADKTVKIGINLPFTGADARDAELIKDGAMLAFDEANAAGGVGGYKIDVELLDDGTATAGQYDPAQAATNARKMVSDDSVVAAIGPQMSGSGKAMSPILSEGGLATITPSSTNPDITNPKFAGQYRPKGKAIYFRTVTTDAFQGPNMANYFADTLKVKSVYVLDDSGAYGVGLADAFQAQAAKRGIKVLGRDQLNPKEADYTTTLTKIKSLKPDALYYGGVAQAGVKVVKQSYDILPDIVKSGGDGVYGAEILTGAGFPAAQGWYATTASPNMIENPDAAPMIERFVKKYGQQPGNYSITAYDAALVILDAVKAVAASGKEVTRDAVRDAIQQSHVKTLQGEVSFDDNGDIENRVVSVFRITRNDKYPLDDVLHQYKYMGVAPASS
ncbi:MAG TPA: branched-chain amino acid ABC transporter substrate-binding protein [Stellaceae bacterium]|nr:branched-chain amino acid ABC transporter substrate-binding protein [Stellaceae bacterium]